MTDAFQRAEFWKYAQPTGINPTFAVNLAFKTLTAITIKVPFSWGPAEAAISCGNGRLGAVNINHLDSFLRKTVIPSLTTQGLIGPATLPIFLLHNFVEYIGTNPTTGCCVLGYHNAFSTTGGVQTYALAMYDNSKFFKGSSDISALSHEVGEWQNDPYTNNPTPSWGHIGQVTGCQSNLEVGDPLSGTTFTDGRRIHVPSPGTGLLLMVLPPVAEPRRERLVLQSGHVQNVRDHLHLTASHPYRLPSVPRQALAWRGTRSQRFAPSGL